MKKNLLLIILGLILMTTLIGYSCYKFIQSYNKEKYSVGTLETVDLTSGSVKTNYSFIPSSSNPNLQGAYTVNRVTVDSINNEIILSTIFKNIKTDTNIDKSIVESTAKIIYGQNYRINHESFDNYVLEKKCKYENFTYLCSNLKMDKVYVLSQPFKAEQNNDEMHIYDKVIYAKYVVDENNNKNLVIWKPNTTKERTFTPEEVEAYYGNYDVIQYPSQLIEKNDLFQVEYKHTFKSRGDGSYYWLHSEPLNM